MIRIVEMRGSSASTSILIFKPCFVTPCSLCRYAGCFNQSNSCRCPSWRIIEDRCSVPLCLACRAEGNTGVATTTCVFLNWVCGLRHMQQEAYYTTVAGK